MKKSILLFAMGLVVLTACDPEKETKDLELNYVSESALDGCLTIVQTDEAGTPAADGNYFHYTTSPATEVAFYNLLASGDENVLAHGSSGSFVIAPKRGSDPNQTFYVRVVNTDGSISKVSRTYNVFVKQDLDPEIRLLASDSYGKKTWKWDTSLGEVWGNMGYMPGSGESVALEANGKWWGVALNPETGELDEFMNQLQHTPDGAAHGDESINAYFVMDEDGNSTVYDKDGNEIRKDGYTVTGYTGSYDGDNWKLGNLNTKAILWPYEINSGGNNPGTFEIVYLTADKMCLVYPDGGSQGGWGEASFWHFKSDTDIEGMAVGYGKTAAKDWTWDYDGTNTVWGNMGYCGGEGAKVGTSHEGQWWGCVTEEEFAGQTQHSNTGALNGDESPNAYFTLDAEGNITRHAGDGSVINKGSYEIEVVEGNPWKVADLNTTAGTILWPFEINSGGNMPTKFEVVYLTGDKMCLVYPDGGDFGGLGNWGEATYWHFKAK
jgi:hypothetical protein